MTSYDVIVLGLGAMGSAAAYQLAKRGARVVSIDQFAPPHVFGSSHGDSRITRLAIGEGTHYSPLAMRSHEIWREIEKETGARLLVQTGGLMISSPARTGRLHVDDFFSNTVAAAMKYGIVHETLDARDIRRRFPAFAVRDNEIAYYEPEAGYLRPEECIRAQVQLAKKYGAEIRTNEKALSFDAASSGVTVTTDKGTYSADALIVSTGAWLPQLLGARYAKPFAVRRQLLFWFDVDGPIAPYQPGNFPIFIWELQSAKQAIYGFPAVDGQKGGVKVATQQYETTTTPETVNRAASPEEARAMHQHYVAGNLPGLSPRVVKSAVCLYTVTPDAEFVIDRHPQFERVIVASPCSGHGFKHSAAIGQELSELALNGKTRFDLSAFRFARFSECVIPG
jgi:sarcosine oxidase